MMHLCRGQKKHFKNIECIQEGKVPTTTFHECKQMKRMKETFLKKIYNENGGKSDKCMIHCINCQERWFDTIRGRKDRVLNGYFCRNCEQNLRKYSDDNDMNPFPRWEHLKLPKLTVIEEMLIARIYPFMRVYRMSCKLLIYHTDYFSFVLLRCTHNLVNS